MKLIEKIIKNMEKNIVVGTVNLIILMNCKIIIVIIWVEIIIFVKMNKNNIALCLKNKDIIKLKIWV